MSGRNKNIYFQEATYNRLLQAVGVGKLSKFVNEAVEEKLQQKEKHEQEELRKQIIAGYQQRTKNKNLKILLQDYGEMSVQDLTPQLTKKKHAKN